MHSASAHFSYIKAPAQNPNAQRKGYAHELSDALRWCPLRLVVVAIALPLNRLRTRALGRTQEGIVLRGADRAERAARDPSDIISPNLR